MGNNDKLEILPFWKNILIRKVSKLYGNLEMKMGIYGNGGAGF